MAGSKSPSGNRLMAEDNQLDQIITLSFFFLIIQFVSNLRVIYMPIKFRFSQTNAIN